MIHIIYKLYAYITLIALWLYMYKWTQNIKIEDNISWK